MELSKLFDGMDMVVYNTCTAIKAYEDEKEAILAKLEQRFELLEGVLLEHTTLMELFIRHMERGDYG